MLKRAALAAAVWLVFATPVGAQQAGEVVAEGPLFGRVVVLDPGHALRDASGTIINQGSIGPGGTEEHDVVLSVSVYLAELIEQAGGKVLATRNRANPWRIGADARADNVARGELANDVRADAFIRIHADASEDRLARGCQVFYFRQDSLPLAEVLLSAFVESTGVTRRGVFLRHEYGLDASRAPSASIEIGVISNALDERLLGAEAFQRRAAQGILDGLTRYFSQVPRPSEGAQAEAPQLDSAKALTAANEVLVRSLLEATDAIPCEIGLVAQSLTTGESAMIRANVLFPAMGLMRLIVLAEATRQVQSGELHPSTVPQGENRTVFQLIQAMMINNDGDAADRLVKLLGKRRLLALMVDLGMTGSTLDHDFAQVFSPEPGPRNMTTASDMASVLLSIEAGELISAEASRAIRAMLAERRDGRMIAAAMPQGAQIAHLAGQGRGAVADAAMVTAGGAHYVAAILATDPQQGPPEPLAATVTRLAGVIHEHFTRTFVHIETTPPGLKVSVNGFVKGLSPCLVQITSATPEAQTFLVSAESEAGARAETHVDIKQGDRLDVSLSMDRATAVPEL